MKFKYSAPAVLIITIIMVVSILTVLSNLLLGKLTSSVEENQYKLMHSIQNASFRSAEDRALARAEMVASLPNIQQIFAARDRDRLIAECKDLFQVQKDKYGVDQAQFHIPGPPVTSFLRLQALDKFGDDLTKFRPLVVAVNQDRLPRKGFAIARTGPAIFGVVPVFDSSQNHIGSFEFGIDFGTVLDSLKSSYELEATLFIEEQQLRDFATGVNTDILNESNRVGKYIKFHSTHWQLMKELAKSEDISGGEDTREYSREVLGVPYGVVLVRLRNNSGKPMGVVAIAKDFSASQAAAGRSRVWQSLLAAFAIIVLSGVCMAVIRGLLLRPIEMLTQRYSTLIAGEPQPIEKVDMLCEEMQLLVKQYEQMCAKEELSRSAPTEGEATQSGKGVSKGEPWL